MGTIEQYWKNCEDYGFIREETTRGQRFLLPSHMGEGGFELLGDPTKALATITDITLYKPWVVFEHVGERYVQFSQFYTGKADFYQKKSQLYPINHGLNYLVNYPTLSGYKKVEANQRLLDIGIFYRQDFFETLPFSLPEDFWETAASVLNPDLILLPPITLICEQLRNCRLEGKELEIFVYGKAYEALSLTLNYVYTHKKNKVIYLSSQDRTALEDLKEILKAQMLEPPSIEKLTRLLGMNQKKLTIGFKQLNGMTIYNYLKHLRMEKAAQLLQENTLPISEIAFQVGYHGDGHFQKAFKDIYGVTPSKLRKELHAK